MVHSGNGLKLLAETQHHMPGAASQVEHGLTGFNGLCNRCKQHFIQVTTRGNHHRMVFITNRFVVFDVLLKVIFRF